MIAAIEADRCTVVVTLVEVHAEAFGNGQYRLGEQGRAVGVKQVIQRTAKPIIAEVIHLLSTDAKHPARKAVDRLLLAVNRLARDDDRAQRHAKGPGPRHHTARVWRDAAEAERLHADGSNGEMG